MSKNTQRGSAQQTPASVEFASEEAIALTRKQIKAFLAHTNNDAVVRELETVLKSGRNQAGWKHFGREFLAAIQEHAFSSN